MILALVSSAAGAPALAVLFTPSGGDYSASAAVSGDNAGPALDALVHGHFGAFAAKQPLMGLTSMLLRLPAAAVASRLGSSQLTVYRLGALACLLPAALFSVWLLWQRRSSVGGMVCAAFAAYVVLLAPTTVNALGSGHPEEPLAAVLASAAVLAALAGKGPLAGVLLGLAVGTKQWALLAALPVLIALPGPRKFAVGAAVTTAALLLAPQVLADPTAFTRASHSLGSGHLVNAFSVWWPISHRLASLPPGAPLVAILPLKLTKSAALAALLVAATTALSVAAFARRTHARTVDPMAALALLALVRCLADPGPVEYYYVAVLIPLAAWEVAVLERPPVVTAAALGAVSLTFGPATHTSAQTVSAVVFAWATALAAYLLLHTLALKRPGRRPITVTCEG